MGYMIGRNQGVHCFKIKLLERASIVAILDSITSKQPEKADKIFKEKVDRLEKEVSYNKAFLQRGLGGCKIG